MNSKYKGGFIREPYAHQPPGGLHQTLATVCVGEQDRPCEASSTQEKEIL